MYSLVLLAAMSSTPETVEFNDYWVNRRIYATWGMYGAGVIPSGYTGVGCYGRGCMGLGFLGLGGRWPGRMVSCYGCTGCSGCYGRVIGTGCCGVSRYTVGCTGCSGTFAACSGCCGVTSLYSSCSGCSGYSFYGGSSSFAYPSMGCTGCSGCIGNMALPTTGTIIEMKEIPTPAPSAPAMKDKVSGLGANRASVLVHLPADAKLYANGQLTTLTSAERFFNTPELPNRDPYMYQLKVEYNRDGQTIHDEQKVMVRAGEQTEVQFVDKVATLATSKALVKLPADAKLFIDEQESKMTGSERELFTPKLQRGEQYLYRFRAEVVRDGRKEVQTQVVRFKAGEPFEVDFRDLDLKPGLFVQK